MILKADSEGLLGVVEYERGGFVVFSGALIITTRQASIRKKPCSHSQKVFSDVITKGKWRINYQGTLS